MNLLLLFHFAFLIVIWILNMKCKFKCISFLICLAFPLYYFYKSILELYQQWFAHCIMRASALENIAFWAGNPKKQIFLWSDSKCISPLFSAMYNSYPHLNVPTHVWFRCLESSSFSQSFHFDAFYGI